MSHIITIANTCRETPTRDLAGNFRTWPKTEGLCIYYTRYTDSQHRRPVSSFHS
uniref:Uncharacterized protein n=1 Tax=Manihot esculenta TaxID=3983 RepID=A0A2C9W481_MANES